MASKPQTILTSGIADAEEKQNKLRWYLIQKGTSMITHSWNDLQSALFNGESLKGCYSSLSPSRTLSQPHIDARNAVLGECDKRLLQCWCGAVLNYDSMQAIHLCPKVHGLSKTRTPCGNFLKDPDCLPDATTNSHNKDPKFLMTPMYCILGNSDCNAVIGLEGRALRFCVKRHEKSALSVRAAILPVVTDIIGRGVPPSNTLVDSLWEGYGDIFYSILVQDTIDNKSIAILTVNSLSENQVSHIEGVTGMIGIIRSHAALALFLLGCKIRLTAAAEGYFDFQNFPLLEDFMDDFYMQKRAEASEELAKDRVAQMCVTIVALHRIDISFYLGENMEYFRVPQISQIRQSLLLQTRHRLEASFMTLSNRWGSGKTNRWGSGKTNRWGSGKTNRWGSGKTKSIVCLCGMCGL